MISTVIKGIIPPLVTVVVSNPDDMRLSVTADMTVSEWRYITGLIKTPTVQYYGPLDDLIRAIDGGIAAIKNRREVRYEASKEKGE